MYAVSGTQQRRCVWSSEAERSRGGVYACAFRTCVLSPCVCVCMCVCVRACVSCVCASVCVCVTARSHEGDSQLSTQSSMYRCKDLSCIVEVWQACREHVSDLAHEIFFLPHSEKLRIQTAARKLVDNVGEEMHFGPQVECFWFPRPQRFKAIDESLAVLMSMKPPLFAENGSLLVQRVEETCERRTSQGSQNACSTGETNPALATACKSSCGKYMGCSRHSVVWSSRLR